MQVDNEYLQAAFLCKFYHGIFGSADIASFKFFCPFMPASAFNRMSRARLFFDDKFHVVFLSRVERELSIQLANTKIL